VFLFQQQNIPAPQDREYYIESSGHKISQFRIFFIGVVCLNLLLFLSAV